MSNPYEICIKVAHRYLYGYLHHSQMAAFFDLLKMPITADNQRKNAIEDAKKRQKFDEYIVKTFEKMPLYTASNIETVAKELMMATHESIKSNKPEWLKRAIEALVRYEKDTIAMFEMLTKEAEQAQDNKLAETIKKLIEDVKEELKVIQHFQSELEAHNYDYEKFKKEKGGKDMPKYYDDRHREERRRQLEKELRRLDMDDARYEPMGDIRHYPFYMDDMDDDMDDRFYPYMLPFMDDDREEPMYDRRGVPGTGRYARRRRRYR